MATRGEAQSVLATAVVTRARLRAHWRLKVLLPTVSIAVFFLAYFAVLRHPLWPVTVMPQTALDRLIPFQPAALILYFTLWAYLSLPPGLLARPQELVFYYLGMCGLALLGLVAFVLWPTAAPVPDIDWARYPSFVFLKTVDASGNACPSLHAAFAVFTALWAEYLTRECGLGRGVRWINRWWGLGIVYSTLATKQHVAVDVYAGAALGALVAAAHIAAFRYARERYAAFSTTATAV